MNQPASDEGFTKTQIQDNRLNYPQQTRSLRGASFATKQSPVVL